MRLSCFFVLISLILVSSVTQTVASSKNSWLGSIFSRKLKTSTTTTTTLAPQQRNRADRCNSKTSQCSAYECCNQDQTCLRRRCFPRLNNCPVTRDQCGQACCKTSEVCQNGKCMRLS